MGGPLRLWAPALTTADRPHADEGFLFFGPPDGCRRALSAPAHMLGVCCVFGCVMCVTHHPPSVYPPQTGAPVQDFPAECPRNGSSRSGGGGGSDGGQHDGAPLPFSRPHAARPCSRPARHHPPPPPSSGSPARTPTPTPTTLSPPAEGGAPPRPFDFGSYATASVAAAGIVGAALASRAAAAGVAGVVWKTHPPPRYHGKVKAVVDALAAEGVTVYSRGEPAGGPVAAHAPPGREGGGAPSEGEEVELGGGDEEGEGEWQEAAPPRA